MSAGRLLQCLCGAVVAVCFLMGTAAPSAYAGSKRSHAHGSFGKSGHGGRVARYGHKGHSYHGKFKSHKRYKHSRFSNRHHFHKGHKHRRFARRHHYKRRYAYVPYYGYGYGYRYRRAYRYRDYPAPRRNYPANGDTVAQPNQDIPVTPKWVHVYGLDGTEGPPTSEDPYGEGVLRKNCLNVKTEIMIDGQPVEAFGQACQQANGSWQLVP